ALGIAGFFMLVRESARVSTRPRLRLSAALLVVASAALFRREMLLAQALCGLWATWRAWSYQPARPPRGPLARARNALPVTALAAALIVAVQFAWIPSGPPATALASAPSRASSTTLAGAAASQPGIVQWATRLGTRAMTGIYNVADAQAVATVEGLWLTGLATALALIALFVRGQWKMLPLTASALAVAWPSLENILAGPDTRSVHGLVIAAPILLGGIALAQGKQRRAALLLYGIAGTFAAAQLVVFNTGPSVGLEWGPRLALVIYPLAAVA